MTGYWPETLFLLSPFVCPNDLRLAPRMAALTRNCLTLPPVQGRLLLAVGSVRHRHPLLASLRLHGGDVEDKVSVEDALPRLLAPHHPAVLTEGVADPADVQVVLGDLHLPAHGERLAGILAVGVAAV